MSFLAKLFGSSGAGKVVKDIGKGVSTLAMGIRTAITGEIPPKERAELEKIVLEAEALSQRAQQESNKIEAGHPSLFVAGWRPAIGWVCALSLATYFIPKFVVATYLWVRACLAIEGIVAYPISPDGLFQLVLALLGMGGLRTLEKKWRVNKDH